MKSTFTKIKVYVFPYEKTGKETIFRLQADRLQVYVVHLCMFGRQPVYAWTKSFLIHHVVANAMARGIICLLVWISAEVHHFSVKNEKRSVTRFRGFNFSPYLYTVIPDYQVFKCDVIHRL